MKQFSFVKPKNLFSGSTFHFPNITHTDWVLRQRAKCTHVIRRGDRYYLYKVMSVWNREKGRGKHKAMRDYFQAQHRMGTIAVLTDLDEDGERIFELLKSRVDIEQLYDTFKNTIHADRSYMRDDYQLNGWLFVNFIAMMLYYRIYNLLVSHGMLRRYSPMDVIEHLSRVQMLNVDGRWIMTEIPKKTREIMAQLEIPVIQN